MYVSNIRYKEETQEKERIYSPQSIIFERYTNSKQIHIAESEHKQWGQKDEKEELIEE